jgi:hypothetical protein
VGWPVTSPPKSNNQTRCKEHKVKFHQTNVGPVSGTSFLEQKDKLGVLKRTETVDLSQWFCHFGKVRVCAGD